MSTRLMILPYLQGWDGDKLAVRLLFGPAGNPLDPLLPGQPSFMEASFQLEMRLVQGLAALPTLGGPHTPIHVAGPAPPRAVEICRALERTLPIDTTVPPVDPRASGARFLKYAPPGYRRATGMSGSSSPYIVTGDRYRCAIQGAVPSGTRLRSDPPKIPWGKVMALALRQPLLAEAIGLVRPVEIVPPEGFFVEGGWLYVSLGPASDAAALVSTPGALKLYAARVPPLTAPRSLFTSVLFPVAATPPAAPYDELFQEVLEYDDGFAKAVYAAQPMQMDPLQEEDDGTRPANDTGAQIGWDDEQVARWLNRPVDPAAATQDAPTGVLGYRVDGRLAGDTVWRSLVRGETRLVLDGVDLGAHAGDFHVEIAPNKLMGDTSGTYWMPTYFAIWKGPSLVGPDPVELALQGIDPRSAVVGTAPDLELRYGRTYEFRARLVDHTGGGPSPSAEPRNPSPQPIATLRFQRWVRPQAVRVATRLPVVPDPTSAPSRIDVLRPLLGYPALVYAGGSAAELLADLPLAQAERRGVGRPDPDVLSVEVTVEVEHPAGAGGFLTLYRTTRAFPADASRPMQLDLAWQDVRDAAALAAPATGPLPIPTARNVRIGLVALGRDDPGYFGAADARRSPVTYASVRREASDERSIWLPFTPSEALQGIFLQPEQTVEHAVAIAQRAAGKGLAAPDNALGRLAAALDVEAVGTGLRARRGRRVLFGCSPALRHVIGPDGGSLSFASIGDLTQIWLVALRISLDRDWSWDGLDHVRVERGGAPVGRLEPRRSVAQEAQGAPREKSEIVYVDALDPKPEPGQHPREIDLAYRLVPVFRAAPARADAPLEMSIRLPVTTAPAQIPRLVSAGLALSSYRRDAGYSRTEPRRRALWLELEEPPSDPRDGYFARVLARAPDPALLRGGPDVAEPAEPPLPVDPEPIRTIVSGQSDDQAGLGAMQALLPTDSPRHFVLPLPPGLTDDSAELFGFFTYELRVGHREGWSTAQGRFGRPLRVTGVQHPAPPLACQVMRTRRSIEITAPFADPILDGQSVRPLPPVTQLWALLYAQVVQADAADHRNVLLDARQAVFRPRRDDLQRRRAIAESGTAAWSNAEVADLCRLLGLGSDAPLSCLVVETLPGDQPVPDPVGAGLGYERFLRTSPLTPIPAMCV